MSTKLYVVTVRYLYALPDEAVDEGFNPAQAIRAQLADNVDAFEGPQEVRVTRAVEVGNLDGFCPTCGSSLRNYDDRSCGDENGCGRIDRLMHEKA